MKPLLLLLLVCPLMPGDAAEEFVTGTVDVREAIQVSVKRLDPAWTGSVTRILPVSDDTLKRELLFTHFIRDASAHSDPDCPRPHLPAIFHAEPGDHGTINLGIPAIYAAMHEDWVLNWRTLGDVLTTCPNLIRAYDEEVSDECGYWFNTFMVGAGEEEMEVFLISFTGPVDSSKRDARIKDLEVWKGILKPIRTASKPSSTAVAPEGGSR